MKTLLDSLKILPKQPLTDEIKESLKIIQGIANTEFFAQGFYGNAALNRQMLLDQRITEHLTPEVIAYLFTNAPEEIPRVNRDYTPGGVSLQGVIYFGLLEGLYILKFMHNNEENYGRNQYEKQQEKFEANTIPLVEKIILLTGSEAKLEDLAGMNTAFNGNTMRAQFELAVICINALKTEGKSAELLGVPGFTPDEMRYQVVCGFRDICNILKIPRDQQGLKISLKAFCQQFLLNEEATLNGVISHLFYDRAHIEAALEQNTRLNFNGSTYTFQEVFRRMIEELSTNPEQYPNSTREQFSLRFNLVEADLKSRHASVYNSCARIQKATLNPVSRTADQKTEPALDLLDEKLMEQLTKYSSSRFTGEAYTNTFFGYSEKDKRDAVIALNKALSGDSGDLMNEKERYLKILRNGTLGDMLRRTLKEANQDDSITALVTRLTQVSPAFKYE